MLFRNGVLIIVLRRPCLAVYTNRRQQPVHGGGTHGQQAFPHRGIQFQMPMALHCVDQPSDHLAEPFATDSIGGLPNDRQRFSNGFVVDPRPLSRFRSFPFR